MNFFGLISLIIFIDVFGHSFSTIVNRGRPISCSQVTISKVKIHDCDKEPCRLERGLHAPIEIEFTFKTPKSTNKIDFGVFASYWSVKGEGSFYGSYIEEGKTCKDFKIQCPPQANRRYTLKTTIFADPNIINQVTEENTGDMGTSFRLTMISNVKGSNSSQCSFNVDFDVAD